MTNQTNNKFWKYYFVLNVILFASVVLWIFVYYKVSSLPDKKQEQTTTITNSLVNQKWADQKDVLLVFSKNDEDANKAFNELAEIPVKMFWIEKSEVWYINEEYENFSSLSEKLWVIKWTPLVAIKSDKVDILLNNFIEKQKEHFTNDEEKELFKKEFKEYFIEENWYRIMRLWDYSIWWKNECSENDWTTDNQCSKIVYVYDQRCNKKECTNNNIDILKWVTRKKAFYKEFEIKSKEAQELVKMLSNNNIKEINLPFFVVYKKDFENNKDQLYEIASSSNELTKLDNDSYYLVPEFVKNDWKEWTKFCTLDEKLVQENSNEYLSCSTNECKDSFECVKEEPNTAEIFTMWYCPYCKDHVKQLKEIKNQLKDTKFSIKYLTSFDTNKKVEELKIDDFNALHWKDEVNENVRQICINSKYWEEKLFDYFVNRFDDTFDSDNVESNLKDVLKKLNIKESDLNNCRNEKFVIEKLVNDLQDAQNFWINSTPSWLINKKYVEQISKDEIKEKICSHNKWVIWC